MFTKREIRLIDDSYFKIINVQEQYIELQSINSGHCWNVFKNQFESSYKIVLYHKKRTTDASYCKYKQCKNVAEALQEIKSYDVYIAEQARLLNERAANTKQQKPRSLKVYETSGYNYKPTPTIILKGEWLKEWGFDSGIGVNVVCSKSKEGAC